MTILDGQAMKNHNLYPFEKLSKYLGNPLWDELKLESDNSQPLLTPIKAQYFKDDTKYDIINCFISNPLSVTSIEDLREEDVVEDLSPEHMKTTPNINSILVKIEPCKNMNVNLNLNSKQD